MVLQHITRDIFLKNQTLQPFSWNLVKTLKILNHYLIIYIHI